MSASEMDSPMDIVARSRSSERMPSNEALSPASSSSLILPSVSTLDVLSPLGCGDPHCETMHPAGRFSSVNSLDAYDTESGHEAFAGASVDTNTTSLFDDAIASGAYVASGASAPSGVRQSITECRTHPLSKPACPTVPRASVTSNGTPVTEFRAVLVSTSPCASSPNPASAIDSFPTPLSSPLLPSPNRSTLLQAVVSPQPPTLWAADPLVLNDTSASLICSDVSHPSDRRQRTGVAEMFPPSSSRVNALPDNGVRHLSLRRRGGHSPPRRHQLFERSRSPAPAAPAPWRAASRTPSIPPISPAIPSTTRGILARVAHATVRSTSLPRVAALSPSPVRSTSLPRVAALSPSPPMAASLIRSTTPRKPLRSSTPHFLSFPTELSPGIVPVSSTRKASAVSKTCSPSPWRQTVVLGAVESKGPTPSKGVDQVDTSRSSLVDEAGDSNGHANREKSTPPAARGHSESYLRNRRRFQEEALFPTYEPTPARMRSVASKGAHVRRSHTPLDMAAQAPKKSFVPIRRQRTVSQPTPVMRPPQPIGSTFSSTLDISIRSTPTCPPLSPALKATIPSSLPSPRELNTALSTIPQPCAPAKRTANGGIMPGRLHALPGALMF